MSDFDEVVGSSDEDFLNLPLPEDTIDVEQKEFDEDSDASVQPEADKEVEADVEKDDDLEPEGDEPTDDDPALSDEEPTGDDDPAADNGSNPDDDNPDADPELDPEEEGAEESSEDPEEEKADDAEPTSSDNWDAITAPFKANNSEMKVDKVEDIRRLMQMGANYHQKMSDMKGDRKVIETLRDNELLSPEKLNLLIDASKGNQAAITQLIKDSGLNPMDLDVDSNDYEATSYQTTDQQLELRDVLSGIRDSATYTQTMDVVSKKWDTTSQEAIMGKPEVLNTINDHMQSGVYDIIAQNVASQRVLGKLAGVDDITAYIQVGNQLQDAGAFNQSVESDAVVEKKAVVKPKPVPKKVVKPKDDAKRRQAAAPRNAPPAKAVLDFDKMSDDEFSKHFGELDG